SLRRGDNSLRVFAGLSDDVIGALLSTPSDAACLRDGFGQHTLRVRPSLIQTVAGKTDFTGKVIALLRTLHRLGSQFVDLRLGFSPDSVGEPLRLKKDLGGGG